MGREEGSLWETQKTPHEKAERELREKVKEFWLANEDKAYPIGKESRGRELWLLPEEKRGVA